MENHQFTPRWEELPPELLELIFENCIEAEDEEHEEPSSILNYRLVSTQWKASMDKMLERKSLETWTKWSPNRKDQPLPFPTLPLVSALLQSQPLEWAACLPTIYSGEHKGCPFPTKSVTLQFNKECRIPEGNQLIRVENFFQKTGHYLNSLEITALCVDKDVLWSILNNSPNLKALSLENVTITTHFTNEIPLAPLTKLTHLQFHDLHRYTWRRRVGGGVENWLLSACAAQLVSLDTDHDFSSEEDDPLLVTLPKLKNLKVTDYHDALETHQALMFSSEIEHISFLDLTIGANKMTQMIQFIGRFTNTLASLHLDFKEDSFDFLERSAERDAIFLSLSFPNVHTFGIFYPHRIEEWCLLKQFLGMFPNLRKLNLLRLDRARDAGHITLPDDTADVFLFITKSKRRILGSCPYLKRITVEYRHRTRFIFRT